MKAIVVSLVTLLMITSAAGSAQAQAISEEARQALEIKKLYTEKFRQILPGTKVARLMQMENRMDAAIALKIAEGVPLVE